MEIYLNYGKYWWWSLPLLVLGLFIPLFIYGYWTVFILASLNLIFVINNPQKQSLHSSISYYEENIRLNILNLAIALFLTVSNLLIVMLPVIPKTILIGAAWGLCAILLRRYAERTLDYIHRSTLVAYLQTKIPDVTRESLRNLVFTYFPDKLPANSPLAKKYNLSSELADKIQHYYNTYLENNNLNGDLSRED